MARNINYQVNLTVNKSGLDELLLSLKQIQQEQIKALNLGTLTSELDKAGDAAHKLEQILNKSWNSKIGQLDLSRLNNEIKTTYGSIDKLKNNLEAVGMGQYFNKLQSNILNTNLQLKQSNKLLDEMATSMSNTIKWGITSSIFNNITNQIQKAWSYSKALDTSLNSIRIVTGKSADEMERYARVANKAAKELGQSTRDYTDASLIYYQQGLGDEEAQARTETTLKAANVTGQTGQEVSEQLTAVWNGYKVSAAETELYVDKLAAVAASTASDLEELSTGMSKVASAANSAGIDIDQLNGILSTVISVTREAPETIGSSFKTIFARLGDLALDGEDEYGVTLGKVSSQMEQLGIEVLNQKGEMRDMGDIIEDTAAKWQTWTQAQKQAAAVAMAGKMQYSRLIALFDNWDKYSAAVQTSQNAIGTLQEQQDIYIESTKAHLQKLSTEAERTYDILFDTDSVNDMSDAMTSLLKIFNNFLAGMGGGLSSITGLTAMAGNLFNKQIGAGIAGIVQNRQVSIQNQQAVDTAMAFSQTAASQTSSEAEGAVYEQMRLKSQEILALKEKISTEEMNSLLTLRQKAEQESLLAASLQEQYDRQTSMVSIENSLKNQTKLIKEQKQEYAAITQDVQIMDNNRGTRYVEEHNQMLNAQRDILSRISTMKDEELLTDEQIAILEKAKQRDSQNRILTEKQISDLQNISQQVIEQEVQKEKEITRQKELQQQLDNGALDAQKIKAQQNQQALADYQAQLQRQTAIQDMVKGLTTLITLGTTLSGIWKTLNNEELSGWEKFSQISSTLLFTLPMLITNFTSIAKILPGINAMVGATATGTKVLGSSALAATVTIHGMRLAMWEVYLIIAAVIAVITLLVAGIKGLIDAYNADADAARQAAKTAKELEENYNSLSEAAKELKENISGYEDALKSLKDLKIGTEEYAEALETANEKAKELIESLGLYNDYTIKDGVIEINPEALRQAQVDIENRTNSAEQNMYRAKIEVNNAQLKSERTNFSRDVGTTTKREKMINGDYYEKTIQLTDDAIEHIVTKLSEAADAEVLFMEGNENKLRNTINGISDLSNESKLLTDKIIEEKDSLEKLVLSTKANDYYLEQINASAIKRQYDSQLNQIATRNGTAKFDEARYNQVVDIINKGQAQEKVREKKETAANAVDEYLEWGRTYFGREFSFVNKNKAVGDTLRDLGANTNNIGGDINTDEDLAKKYAKYILNKTDDEINKLIFKSGKLQDSSGNVVVDSSNKDQRVEQRAQLFSYSANDFFGTKYEKEAQEPTLDFISNLNQATSNATTLGAKYGTDFSQALLNAISSQTKEFDLSSTFARLDPTEVSELQGIASDPNKLAQMFGLSEDNIEQLGFSSAKQFADNFKAGLKDDKWDIDDAIAASMEKKSSDLEAAGEGLSKKKLEEYSKDVEIYAKNLMQIADSSDEVADGLKYDSDLAVDFALRVIKMNKAIDLLVDNFKDWKDIITKSSETSQEYAEAMYGMRDALADVYDTSMDYVSNDFVKEHLAEIKKIAEGDEKAIEGLRSALSQEIVANILIENKIDNREEILANFQSLRSQIESQLTGLEIGAPVVDDGDLVNSLNKMIEDCQMTVEQANAVFSAMGVEPTYETETVTQEQSNPIIETTTYTEETDGKDLEYVGPDGQKHVAKVPNFKQIQTSKTVGYTKDKVEVPVTAIAMNGKQPKISGIKKAPSGSMNNYSSKNKGGKSPGSSGKSGGGSKKEIKEEKKVEDKKDPYHDIDIKIKGISKDLDKLQKQQSKFFGQKLINNLNNQYDLLGQQIDADTEKIEIARREQNKLQEQLSKKGINFNVDGTISNYAQAYDAQLSYLNGLIDKYNSMTGEEQEKYQKTLDNAKEEFNKFTEAIEEYDKTVTDIIPELEANIQDAIDKQIEIRITEFNMEIEIRLDLAEAERDWNEFKRKVIDGIKDDDILGNAKARLIDFSSYYKADETGIIQKNAQHVLDIKNQIEQIDRTGTSDWYGDNKTKALEDLKTYTDQLMSDLSDVEDLVQEIKDSYLEMMDEAAEKFGDQISLYEQVRDIITHDMNVIELIYGEESYKDLEKYYEKQEENYNKQLDFNRQQKDFWYNQMIAIEKAGGKNSEAWLKAKESWMSAVNEWNSAIEEAIENLQNKYQNAINLIFQGLNDKVTGGLGLEYVSEEWELINQNADQYLDTINSLYGIQDLENKYLDAIDNTDSISAQQKLNELMEEEVVALKEKDKLTQYDIDRANMKYEIALKQIALEEAQQNKSTMRLRRDSQGNYTYQYVADNDQVGQIEDELSALKNELYNFDLEHYRDNLDQVLSIYTEFQEKMAEAALINDPEERQERELLLREQYGELINGLVEQNEDIRTNLHESAFTELADLYGIEYANFQQLSEDEKTVMMEQMIPQWDSAVQHMTDTFAGNDEGEGGFLPTCRDAFKQLDEASKQYQTDLGELQQSAGTDFDNIRNGIDENISKTQELITNNDELIRSYQDQLSAIGAVISELQQLVSQYNAARDAAIAATEAAYGYWKAQQQQAANAASKNVSSGGGNSNSVNSNSNSNNNNSGGSGSSSVESGGGASVGNKITYSGKYYYDSFGTSPAGSKYSGVADGVTIDIVNNNPYGIHVKSSDGKYPDLGWIKKSQVTRWNTGGYTGDWGDDSGRLAILDRKELVLNKEDTPNILNAVEIMRGIANSMNLSMLSRMAGSINGVQNSSNSIAADSDTLEQNVHIDATFPGVKDAREIEQALNNLVNVASQRIGHNRR